MAEQGGGIAVKIIKQGTLPTIAPPWWIAQISECPSGHSESQFEMDDTMDKKLEIKSERCDPWRLYVGYQCPFCKMAACHIKK